MSTLFTYDMLRDIWVPLLSGIIGGLFTLIGVILTIKHERKKDISEHLQEIKPYLVIVHPSEVKRSEWNSQRYIYMLDDENDFDEDDVSTPLYRWDYLCLSNIGSSIGIQNTLKSMKTSILLMKTLLFARMSATRFMVLGLQTSHQVM